MADVDPGLHLLSGYGRALAALLLFHDEKKHPTQAELAASIGMTQPVLANYVKSLTERGLVKRRRRRGRVYYKVAPVVHPDVEMFRRIVKWLDDSDLANATEGHVAMDEEVALLDPLAGGSLPAGGDEGPAFGVGE
jgi:DNA-binding HxlR family transcriptional regulator